MASLDARSETGIAATQEKREERADEVDRRTRELIAFRDAGVLTDSELEEEKVRLRWNIR